jgi:hypothetical protein
MAKSLTEEQMEQLRGVLEVHWPELNSYDEKLITQALNEVEDVAVEEGVQAVTPECLIEIKMKLKRDVLKQMSKKAHAKVSFKKKK